MNRIFFCSTLFLILSSVGSCQLSKTKEITEKNKCYEEKLENLRSNKLYQEIFSLFRDTFEVLKTKKEYFGVPSYVENKIDEAIFFKKDSSECLLIVLQRMADTAYVFGSARIVHGIKENTKWRFEVGLEYNFGKDYFKLYNKNTFENISMLSRYSVLTNGDIKREGCEIDDHYWFEYLKK